MFACLLVNLIFLPDERLTLIVSFLKEVSAIIILEPLLLFNNWLWCTLWLVVTASVPV